MVIASVREVLKTPAFLVIAPDSTLQEAFDLMTVREAKAVVVLENGDLRGILTIGDVLRHVSQFGEFRTARADQAMTRNVLCVETRDSLIVVQRLLRQRGISQVPVKDLGNKVIGLLRRKDIWSHLANPTVSSAPTQHRAA